MNEIEKAISEIIGTNYGECQCHRETMVQAVEALHEKQTRESGCDYCLTTWPNRDRGLSDIWHGNQLSVGYGIYREINYCPMCGRELEEHHEDD